MKRYLEKIFTALLVFTCTLPLKTFAYSFKADGIYYNISSVNPNYVEVTKEKEDIRSVCYSGDIVIPDTVVFANEKYAVKSLRDYVFYEASFLTSVFIPKTVTRIGKQAFLYNKGLTYLTVEEGNPVYDSREDCNAIIETASNTLLYGSKKTIIPNSVTLIGDEAFHCIELENGIHIPNSVTSIGEKAFRYAGRNFTLTIPNSVKSIGYGAFQGVDPLTIISEIENPFPISNYIWYGEEDDEEGIKSWREEVVLYVPKGKIKKYKSTSGWASFIRIKEIGVDTPPDDPQPPVEVGGSFSYEGIIYKVISNEPNYVEIKQVDPNISLYNGGYFLQLYGTFMYNGVIYTVKAIGDSAFFGGYITSLSLPNTLTSIGANAFSECTFSENVSRIHIPEGVTTIMDKAFSKCDISGVTLPNSLTYIGDNAFEDTFIGSIIIPKSVTHIGKQAFRLTLMANISVQEGNPVYDSRDNCNAIIETETNTLLYGCLNTIIPNTVTAIGDDAFNGVMFNSDYVLKIPSSVTSIGDRAFRNAELYCSLTIPSSVNHIGSEAFYHYTPSIIYSKIKQPFEIPLDCWLHPEEMEDSEFGLKGYLEKEVVLYVPKGTANAYKNTSGWNIFKQILEMEGSSTPSGINDFQQEDAATKAIYNVNGQRLNEPRKGINIINKKKVLVK